MGGGTRFDFEAIYALYPRRGEGKKAGMLRLQQIILTQADYERFRQAVLNYAALCASERREPRYIKHWKTFVNNYEDYLDVQQPPMIDQLQRVLRGDL